MDEIFKIKLNDTSGKGLYTLVDKDIYELYKDKNIGLDQMGYPCFSQNGRPQRLHKLVLLNIPSRNRILRKNNDKLDNRRDNLYCNIEIIKLLPEYEFIVTNNGISKSFNHWLYDNTVNYNVVIAKYKEFINRLKKNEINFSFSFEDFFRISFLPCEFCGGERSNYSVAMKNEVLGYVSENLQPLCSSCKQTKLSSSKIKTSIAKLKNRHLINKPSLNKRRYTADRPWWLVKYTRIKSRSQSKKIEFTLTPDEYRSLFYGKDCHYCGDIDCDGIDRLNSNYGYIPNNMVPCCYYCNVMKMDMGYDEFLNKIEKISSYIKNKEVGGV
jgi:hypothetical protein